MNSVFYTAASGLSAFQTGLNVSSGNISNINTAGYKEQTIRFEELLYTESNGAGQTGVPTGSGVRTGGSAKNFTQGVIDETGRSLDAALAGEGFFAVQKENGAIFFTRSGNFSTSQEEGIRYLVNSSGDYVLDGSMQKVTVNANEGPVRYGVDDGSMGEGVTGIGIFRFDNPNRLSMVEEGLYAPPQEDLPQAMSTASIRQGCLERSNVELTEAMKKMIEVQRGFQFCAKALTTSDEMEQTANSLR